MNDDAIELAARAVAKIEAEHFGRDLTEADWQAGRLMWRKAVAPLVEQLRQAEVSRDAYREEMRGAKEALGDHLADSREDHLDTRIALAAERESRFRWAEEAAHVTDAAKALLDMEYATASDNRMAWSAWPIEYNDLAVAIGWRGAKRPGDYTLDDLTMAPADRTQMEAERDTALAEIERLRDTLTEQVDATVTQGWEAVGAEYERTAAETEADRLRANLAALRASAVVLPEPVQRLVDWHQSFAGPHVSPMPFQSEVREAMESWRPATVEAAPTAGIALADEIWPPGTEVDPFPDLTEAELRIAVTGSGNGGPGMRDINAAFDQHVPEDGAEDARDTVVDVLVDADEDLHNDRGGFGALMNRNYLEYLADHLLARYDIRERGETALGPIVTRAQIEAAARRIGAFSGREFQRHLDVPLAYHGGQS